MKNLLTVMKYTIKEAVNKKVFRITNIIMCIIIVLVCNIPNIINYFDVEVTAGNKEKLIVTDKENLLGENISVLSLLDENYEFIIDNNLTEDEIKQKIDSEEVAGAIILKNVEDKLSFDYVVKSTGVFSNGY